MARENLKAVLIRDKLAEVLQTKGKNHPHVQTLELMYKHALGIDAKESPKLTKKQHQTAMNTNRR